jgi:hypothetical protein
MILRWVIFFGFVTVAATVVGLPRRALRQDPADDGHSYMRIAIGDHVLTNSVRNEEYQKGGWLAVESVLVKTPGRAQTEAEATEGKPRGWRLLSAEMKSGHHGPGTLQFGVGDNGALDPLLAAQKSGAVVPSADLDLFPDYGAGRALVGKYRIKRIRIVAVENDPASACGMYDVTLRFQSIDPRTAE